MSNLKAGRPSANKPLNLSDLKDHKDTARVNADVPREDFKYMKAYAAMNGLTITELIKEFVATFRGKV